VDDNPVNIRSAGDDPLAPRGHIVLGASGNAALSAVASEQPDLVLLDVCRGRVSVCRRLRADPATGALPRVVMITTSAGEDHIRGFGPAPERLHRRPVDRAELHGVSVRSCAFKHYHDTGQAQAELLTGGITSWSVASAEVTELTSWNAWAACVGSTLTRTYRT